MSFFKNKWIRGILIFIGVLVLGALGTYWWLNESLPQGKTGPEADALAKKIMKNVNLKAWEKTRAISWNFANRRQLIWDRDRHYTQVDWDGNQVLVDINAKTGVVLKKDPEKEATEEEMVDEAWKIWVNDSFWLNPIAKLFDPGTTRSIVDLGSGEKGLLIQYASGGATPGDAYLWLVDENGRPYAWKLWVSIVPFGGFKFTWEKWQKLSTGAWVSGYHHSSLRELSLSDFKASTSLEGLMGEEDIFKALVKNEGD